MAQRVRVHIVVIVSHTRSWAEVPQMLVCSWIKKAWLPCWLSGDLIISSCRTRGESEESIVCRQLSKEVRDQP